ncbi:MAG TPA: CsgG/HfaB family protein [Anaeromyxobacter sp.]|nr:CsgG/HfaB family protein [Anaeromyxobacter sp.]
MSRGLEIVRRFLPCIAVAFALAVPGARAVAAQPTVAVLYFDYDGADQELFELRKGITDFLVSQLAAAETVQLVERTRLQEVLAELDLQQTRRIDPTSAARIGKLLGARYLVFGSYFQLGAGLQASARIVEVETGKILFAHSALTTADDILPVYLGLSDGLKGFLVTKLPALAATSKRPGPLPRGTAAKPVPPPKKLKLKQAKDHAVALDAIDRKDKATAVNKLKELLADNGDFPLAAAQLASLN